MVISNEVLAMVVSVLANHIRSNDSSIILHTDISTLKKFIGTKKNKNACETLRLALEAATKNNCAILTPSFTYSFCKTKIYDIEASMSEVGIYSNYMLTQKDIHRSRHPVFSFVGTGKNAETYCDNVSESAFGTNSIFDRVKRKKGKILFFDASFQSCTFVHHIEASRKVPYRYNKVFDGTMIYQNRQKRCRAINSVRDLNKKVITDLMQFENDLIAAGILLKEETPIGKIISGRADQIYEFGRKKISEDPYYFLRFPPIDC